MDKTKDCLCPRRGTEEQCEEYDGVQMVFVPCTRPNRPGCTGCTHYKPMQAGA